jgi:threonine aldolase
MIDLRSDTVTQPTEEMRRAARDASVGDAKRGDDPTVARLERRVADILGMDDAGFLPSGTMGNQVSCSVHAEPGEEVLVEAASHVYNSEYAGLPRHSGLQPRPVDGGERGVPTAAQVRAGARTNGKSETTLLVLEDTHNRKGGIAIRPERLAEAASAAREMGLAVHLDGARLFNAAVALDRPVDEFTEHVDSVMVSLSKGLGGPIGSAVAGDTSFVDAVETRRNAFGGGMRQAGMVAAPALLALHDVDRLADDHERATEFARGIRDVDGGVVQEPETNIVLVDVSNTDRDASATCELLESNGVLASESSEHVVRFCTHADVDSADVREASAVVERALSE